MHSNVVRGLLKPWTTAAHALFSIISQTFTAERRASHWRENEFCLHLQSGKRRIEIHVKKKKCEECPRRKTNPAHMQRAWDCGDISMKPLNGSLSNLSSGFSHKFPNFLWPINYLGTQHQSWLKRQFKMKRTVKKKQRFLRAKASRLAFLLARAIVARCKRNYPKTRHQTKLRHHWTDLAAN